MCLKNWINTFGMFVEISNEVGLPENPKPEPDKIKPDPKPKIQTFTLIFLPTQQSVSNIFETSHVHIVCVSKK